MRGEAIPVPSRAAGTGPSSSHRAGQAHVAGLLQALEQMRAGFHEQLDEVLALARQRAAEAQEGAAGVERQLRRRIAELEAARAQLQAEVDRLQRERQASVEGLDHDRRLLAEAWERLEREQIQALRSGQGGARAPSAAPEPAAPRAAPAAPAHAGRDDPIAQEILRQFQSLRLDVRRNARDDARG